MGLTGDALAVFCLFAGLAGGGAMTAAATQTGKVRFFLWIAVAVLGGAAVVVWLTASQLNWGAVLPFGYALTPPATVGMVLLILRRWRGEPSVGNLTASDVDRIVADRLAALPKPAPAPAPAPAPPFPIEPLLSALEAIARPLAAKARLDDLESIRVPKLEDPEYYIPKSDRRESANKLYDLGDFLGNLLKKLEKGAGPNLANKLEAAEARALVQALDDPTVWPSMSAKRYWHFQRARYRIAREELARQIGVQKAQSRLDPVRAESMLKSLREQVKR